MQARALTKYIRISPYKLRPLCNVIRGYSVQRAVAYLKTVACQRVKPIEKTLLSAYANAKNKQQNLEMKDCRIALIKVDQGPIYKYFKAGAMGRANVQRKRLSHIEVVVETAQKENQ